MRIAKYSYVREKTASYNAPFIDRKVANAEDVAAILCNTIKTDKYNNEHFFVFCLNTKLQISGVADVSSGTLDAAPVHPRDVFTPAIMTPNTAAVIIAHNHPSGDATPSDADIETTKRLIDAGEILGIKVLDHVIVGDYSYTSIRELGNVAF